MAHYLRDQQIKSLSVTEDQLRQLAAVFNDRASVLNISVVDGDTTGKRAFLSFIIRFDNKGYRVFSLEDLLRYFQQAKSVERVILTIETGESLRSNRSVGSVLELKLDGKDPNACFLTATSDDKDWVDASFSSVQEVLSKCKNRNGWVRTTWTAFLVQLIGITLGFMLSLWGATKIAPKLSIENSFAFSFLFMLLIFSGTWSFLNQQIIRLINFAFPNLKFLRRGKEHIHWLRKLCITPTEMC
ncbi:MAG: hypothetical protein Q7K57_36120 [Burkholderiaceae bacterium]|nr:hypothetical protein [Burkholderiaceae bacterium]